MGLFWCVGDIGFDPSDTSAPCSCHAVVRAPLYYRGANSVYVGTVPCNL